MARSGKSPSARSSYLLVELDSLDNVFIPLKNTSRLKYTCLDVSTNYLVFGSSSGGIFIYQQETLTYLNTVTNKEGPIVQVALAPDDNILGFATNRGHVVVLEHNTERSAAPQRLQVAYEHRGAHVTCLQWNSNASQLFIGDDKGRVSLINVSISRARNIFQVPTASLPKLDSKICQLDFTQDCLLVSTLTRCYLWDTNKQQFIQIGKKLRDGEYGACFYPGPRIQDPSVIFAARPGSRIWEVDMKGNVVCTHQFKQALTVAPKKVVSYRSDYSPISHEEIGTSQSLSFTKLMIVGEREYFVFAWSEKGVYVFDLKRAEVVLWNDEIVGIKEVRCLRNSIFVSFVDGTLSKYSLLPVEKCIIRFFQKGLVKHSALLAIGYQPYLLSSQYCANIIASFLSDLEKQLSSIDEHRLAQDIALLLVQLESVSQSSGKFKLRSRPRDLTGKHSKVRFHGCSISDGDSPTQSPPRGPRARSASPRWPKTHAATRCMKSSPLAKRRPSRLQTPSRLALGKQDSDDSDSWNPRSTSSKSDAPVASTSKREPMPQKDKSKPAADNTKVEVSPVHEVEGAVGSREVPEDFEASASNFDSQITCSLDTPNTEGSESLSSSAYDWIDHVNGNMVLSPEKALQGSISSQDCGALADESSMATSVKSEELFGIDTDSLLTPGDFSDASDRMCLSLQEEILTPLIHKTEEEPQPSCSNAKQPSLEFTVTTVVGEGTSSKSEDDSEDSSIYTMSELYGGSASTSRDTYINLAMYGGGIFLPPSVDFPVLQGTDMLPVGKEELSKLKESISTKLTAGKKVIFKNLKDFESRIKQLGLEPTPELLDVVTPPNNNRKELGKMNSLQADGAELLEYTAIIRFLWSALPHLDKSSFIQLSTEARSKIHDPSITYNTEKVQIILLDWVEQLHELQKKICVLLGHIVRATQNISVDVPDSSPSNDCDEHLVNLTSDEEVGDDHFRHDAGKMNYRDKQPVHENHQEEETASTDFTKVCQFTSLSSAKEDKCNHERSIWQQGDPFHANNLLDLIFVHDPFHFTSSDHALISELAHISFMAKVWGNIEGVEDVLKEVAHMRRTENSLISNEDVDLCKTLPNGDLNHRPKFDAAPASALDKPTCSKFSDMHPQESSHLSVQEVPGEVDDSSGSHRDDHLGSLFVKHYFHLLGASIVHSAVTSSSSYQFRTWSVLVNSARFYIQVLEVVQKLSEDQMSVAIYHLKQHHWDINTLLFSLNEICRVSMKAALDMCLRRESRVTPRDILYISRTATGSPELLLCYIDQVLNNASEARWHELFDKLFSCEEVRWEWISAVLNQKLTEKVKCDCGAPRPGAHLYPWKRGKFLEQVLLFVDECDKLTQMCFDAGFWPGYLQLLKMQHDTEAHLLTVLELGDADLLSDSNSLGCVPSSKDGWKSLLQWMSKQQQPPDIVVCLMCGRKHSTQTSFTNSSDKGGGGLWSVTINWEKVARVLLEHFGTKECLQLFSEVEVPPGSLTSDFFQACILSHLMEKQQSALAYRMLAQLNSYLWSRRPIALSPQIYYLFKKEKNRRESGSVDDSAQGSSGISDDALQLRFIEEPSSHWGVRTSLQGACPLCGLPLTAQLPGSCADGIVAFHCGHSFHKACMDEEICFVCLCESSATWEKSASEDSS